MNRIKELDLKKVFLILPVVLMVILLLYTVVVRIRTNQKTASYVAEYQKLQKENPKEEEKEKDVSYYSPKAQGTALVKKVNEYNTARYQYMQDTKNVELDPVDLKDSEKALVDLEKSYASYVFDDSSQMADWSMVSFGKQLPSWEFVTSYVTDDVRSLVLFSCYNNSSLVCVATAEYDAETNKFGSFSFSPTVDSMIYRTEENGDWNYSIRNNGTPGLLIRRLLNDNSRLYPEQGEKSYVTSLFPDGIYKTDDDTMSDGFMIFYQKEKQEEEKDGTGTENEKTDSGTEDENSSDETTVSGETTSSESSETKEEKESSEVSSEKDGDTTENTSEKSSEDTSATDKKEGH